MIHRTPRRILKNSLLLLNENFINIVFDAKILIFSQLAVFRKIG